MPPLRPPAFISRQVVAGRYFFGDLTAPPGTAAVVACAGWEDCAADYRIERSSFLYHALEFIHNGHWRLTRKNRTTVLGPGSVFVYGPDSGYKLVAIEGKPLRKYFVDLTGPEACSLLRRHEIPADWAAGVFQPERMRQIFDQLIECADLQAESARPLSLHLAELLLMRARVDSRFEASAQGQAYDSYLRARRLIQEHHASLTGVGDAARVCGLSPAYLARLFKRFGGEGPLQFLSRLRMQHAADLLLRHSTNVQETAVSLGFTDPFHFSRVFKRVHGLSPRAFLEARQNGRGGDLPDDRP